MGFVSFILRNLFYALIALAGIIYLYVSYLDVIQSPNVDESLWNHNSKFEPTGKFHFVKVATNGIHLNVLEAGPKDGELLILLHGFPETALTSWYRFIGPFSSAGFHVVAPDMRGYNTSDKPIPVAEYHPSTVANDLVGVIEHFKAKKAILIGHDWGGVIAYQLALDHPEMVKKLVILNAPHPAAMQSKLTSLTQLRKSSYIFLFQVPGAMEGILARYGFSGLRTFMGQYSTIGKTFSSESIPLYVQAWSERYAIQAMIGYYRAAFRAIFTENPFSKKTQISAPTLILWGKKDLALEEDLATLSQQFIPDSRVVYFDDASHFVQHDVPEMVFEQISSFLK